MFFLAHFPKMRSISASSSELDESLDELDDWLLLEDESASEGAPGLNISSKALSSQLRKAGTLRFLPLPLRTLRLLPRKRLRSLEVAATHAEVAQAAGYSFAAGYSSTAGVSCFPVRCMRVLSHDIKCLSVVAMLFSAEIAHSASALDGQDNAFSFPTDNKEIEIVHDKQTHLMSRDHC